MISVIPNWLLNGGKQGLSSFHVCVASGKFVTFSLVVGHLSCSHFTREVESTRSMQLRQFSSFDDLYLIL